MWRYNDVNDVMLPNPWEKCCRWYILLEMDFSLHLSSEASPSKWNCSETSILPKQINNTIHYSINIFVAAKSLWLYCGIGLSMSYVCRHNDFYTIFFVFRDPSFWNLNTVIRITISRFEFICGILVLPVSNMRPKDATRGVFLFFLMYLEHLFFDQFDI